MNLRVCVVVCDRESESGRLAEPRVATEDLDRIAKMRPGRTGSWARTSCHGGWRASQTSLTTPVSAPRSSLLGITCYRERPLWISRFIVEKICREKAPDAVSWYRPHLGDLACSHRADCPWTSFIRRGTEDESDRALCRRGRGGEGGILTLPISVSPTILVKQRLWPINTLVVSRSTR